MFMGSFSKRARFVLHRTFLARMSALAMPLSAESDLKYARGAGPRIASEQRRPPSPLEWCVLAHVSVFLIWSTWSFGGAAESMQIHFTCWGGLGALITL